MVTLRSPDGEKLSDRLGGGPIDAGFAWGAHHEDSQAQGTGLALASQPGMTINVDLDQGR